MRFVPFGSDLLIIFTISGVVFISSSTPRRRASSRKVVGHGKPPVRPRADPEPLRLPRNRLGRRERRVAELALARLGGALLPLPDLAIVDHDIVVVRHAVDDDPTEIVGIDVHCALLRPCPG
jgi:hypothetical protein